MENLENQCLEKLNTLLSKFDLEIVIINFAPLNLWQYRLVDNLRGKTDGNATCLELWLSLNELLFNQQSIFECLESYYNTTNDFNIKSPMYQRYSEVYQSILPLKSDCLEEFLINCDLMGI
jgi:hypothetical protein